MPQEFGEHSLSQNALAMGHFGDRGQESWQDKVSREMSLFEAGWTATQETAKESVSDDRVTSTALQVLTSIAAGVVVAKMAPAKGIVGVAGKSLSIGMGATFLWDIASHARAVAGAVSDTWDSSNNQSGNTQLIESHLGSFLFDIALSTAGGVVGMKLGKSIFPSNPVRPLAATLAAELSPSASYRSLSTRIEIDTNNHIAESGRTLAPEYQVVFDAVIPPETRLALAKRSRMYEPDRAFTFAIAMEQAVPGIEGKLKMHLDEIRSAQLADYYKRVREGSGVASNGGKDYYKPSDYMRMHYSRVIPDHSAVKTFHATLAQLENAVNPIIAETARQAGFPEPKLSFATNLTTERGVWQKGLNRILVNAQKMDAPGDFGKTTYHELTHAEQTNLVARRIADELRLPANPSIEDQTLLYRAFKNCFNVDINYSKISYRRDLWQYISKTLQMRDGKPLAAGDEARAIELIESFKGLAFKNRTDTYYSAMNNYLGTTKLTPHAKSHLLYRSALHEIEAWETTQLVAPLKIKR